MTKRITLILILSIVFTSIGQNIEGPYYSIAKNGLIIRDKPSLKGKKIGKIKYLESVDVKHILFDKQQTVRDNGKIIKGYWVSIEYDDKNAYIFDGFLKLKGEIKKVKREKINRSLLRINGMLSYKCTESEFVKHIEKPDSIVVNTVKHMSVSNNYKIKFNNKFTKLYKYKYYEYEDDIECAHFHGNCHNTKTYYKDGIVYEEFDGEMILVKIDFKNKPNFIEYKKYLWNNKSTFNEMFKLFPLHQTFTNKSLPYYTFIEHQHFHVEIKWHMSFNKLNNRLNEFYLH